ncbi:hypothetical protein EU522_01735 [Candidatus Thorarchaeota archaeon]|nr:MAG: hypothetical protein EU522_01735 [Candidatus Thorarchaeota archaeon]
MSNMEGVDNIIGIIKTKTATQTGKIVSDAETYKNERIRRAKERAETIVENASTKADNEVKLEISKYEASAILKQKYMILNTKEGIMKEVLDSAWDQATKRVGKADYKMILTRLAVQGGAALDVDEIEILLPDGIKTTIDEDEVAKAIKEQTGRTPSVKISKEKIRASGGLIVRAKDGTKWVDNTFEARQERHDSDIRDAIATILFGQEEKS